MKTNRIRPAAITFGVLAAVAIATILLFAALDFYYAPGQRRGMMMNDDLTFFKILISIVNSGLLVYVIYNYSAIYSKIKSNFSLGLIAMAAALFAQSLTSNPLFSQFFGFRGSGLGPFTVIPSIFTLIATIALIYLMRE